MLSFTECNGLEVIEGSVDHLVISEELQHAYAGELRPHPVLVFTPSMERMTECYHIDLTRAEAERLHGWLGKYLEKTQNPTI